MSKLSVRLPFDPESNFYIFIHWMYVHMCGVKLHINLFNAALSVIK